MSRRTFDNPNSDEARQALLDNKAERKHPKRHRTRKRSRMLAQKKRREGVAKAAENKRRYQKYKAGVRAYFAGETNEHP